MGIGKLRCQVIDVDNLAVAEAFWSEVTGLPIIASGWTGRFSYLGQPDPWKHEIILQLRKDRKGEAANRSHVDLTVDDVDAAVSLIEALGGRLKKQPSIYPRPGEFPGEGPRIDWAVMQDPFGNEFCLVSTLSSAERTNILQAAGGDAQRSDSYWRAAAGRASTEQS